MSTININDIVFFGPGMELDVREIALQAKSDIEAIEAKTDNISFVSRTHPVTATALRLSVDGVGMDVFPFSSGATVILSPQTVDATANGRTVVLRGGSGGSTSGNGGAVNILGGLPVDGNGGGVTVRAENGIGTSRSGGALTLTAGNSTGTVNAAAATLTSGSNSTGGAAGGLTVQTGTGGAASLDVRNRSTNGSVTVWLNDAQHTQFEVSAVRPNVDNALSLGASGSRWTQLFAASGVINTSDARWKLSPVDLPFGLDMVQAVTPKAYRMAESHVVMTAMPVTDEDGNVVTPAQYESVEGTRTHFGFLAQDVREYLGSNEYAVWTLEDPNDPDSRQGLRESQLIAVLWKAVQELSARVTELESA